MLQLILHKIYEVPTVCLKAPNNKDTGINTVIN